MTVRIVSAALLGILICSRSLHAQVGTLGTTYYSDAHITFLSTIGPSSTSPTGEGTHLFGSFATDLGVGSYCSASYITTSPTTGSLNMVFSGNEIPAISTVPMRTQAFTVNRLGLSFTENVTTQVFDQGSLNRSGLKTPDYWWLGQISIDVDHMYLAGLIQGNLSESSYNGKMSFDATISAPVSFDSAQAASVFAASVPQTEVPEPASLALLGSAAFVLLHRRRRCW